MKTIEFPLNLDPAQQVKVIEWMDALTHVYNRGIALLEWRQFYYRLCQVLKIVPDYHTPVRLNVTKVNDDWAMYCDCTVKVRIDKTKSWDEENIEYRPACSIVKSHWFDTPLIHGYSTTHLRKPFARKRYKKLGNIPQLYVNEFISIVVSRAWANYLDANRPDISRPRYKGKRHPVRSIPCDSFRSSVKLDLDSNRLELPGLGWIQIPLLSTLLGNVMRRQKMQMTKHPDKYPELERKLNERDAFLKVANFLENNEEMPPDTAEELQKAVKCAEKILTKTGKVSVVVSKLREYAEKREFHQAIEDLCTPGAFRICRRENKFFLQILVRSVVNQGHPKPDPIGIDTGLNLLCHASNGIQIKHPDLSRFTERINRLKQKQSKMKPGSQNWHRIQNKISRAERKKKQAKRQRQHYVASWLVDVHQNLAIKKFDLRTVVGRPLPRQSKDRQRYLRNEREEQRLINNQIKEAAIGQFVGLIRSKAKDRDGRVVESVPCEINATPIEILEASSFHSGGPPSEQAQNPLGTREGGPVTPTTRGESDGDSSTTFSSTQLSEQVHLAETPGKFRRSRRKPRAERKVI